MIRQLYQSIREYKRDTFLTPVFVILEVFMEALTHIRSHFLSMTSAQEQGSVSFSVMHGNCLPCHWFHLRAVISQV